MEKKCVQIETADILQLRPETGFKY